MRALVLALAVVAAPVALAEEARPCPAEPDEARSEFELDLFLGYGGKLYPTADVATTSWAEGGAALAATLAYRSSHFVHPFLDLSYTNYYRSGRSVYVAPGQPPVHQTGSLDAVGIVIGPGFDFWRVRLRAGFGAWIVGVKSELPGDTITSSAVHRGWLFSASALLWRSAPFQAGVELRFAPVSGVDTGIVSAGLTGSWDFAHF